MLLTTIFYHVDNFCNEIEKCEIGENDAKKRWETSLHASERDINDLYFFKSVDTLIVLNLLMLEQQISYYCLIAR